MGIFQSCLRFLGCVSSADDVELSTFQTSTGRQGGARDSGRNPTQLDQTDLHVLERWEKDGRGINKAIRMGIYDEAGALDRALSKLPRYDGQVGYITHGYHGATADLMPFTP